MPLYVFCFVFVWFSVLNSARPLCCADRGASYNEPKVRVMKYGKSMAHEWLFSMNHNQPKLRY